MNLYNGVVSITMRGKGLLGVAYRTHDFSHSELVCVNSIKST